MEGQTVVIKLTNAEMEALRSGVELLVRNPRDFNKILDGLLARGSDQSTGRSAYFIELVNEIRVQCERMFSVQMERFLREAQASMDSANRLYPWLVAHVPDDRGRLAAIARFFEEVKPVFGSSALAIALNDQIALENGRAEQSSA